MATNLVKPESVAHASRVLFLPEILYHIIELCGDLATLRSCTLVLEAWRYVAQSQLLRSVYLYTALRKRSPNAFITFLESHPDLRHCIRKVTIEKGHRGFKPCKSSASLYELREVVALLPRLNSLSIGDITVYPGPIDTSLHGNLAGPKPQKIEVLELRDTSIDYYSNQGVSYFNILCIFSNITTLRVNDLRYKSPPLDPPDEPTPLPHIGALEIVALRPNFLRDILPCLTSHDLAILRISDNVWDTDDFFRDNQACIEATTNLKEFQFHVSRYGLSDDLPPVSLRTCSSLETVTAVLTVLSEDFDDAPVQYREMWSNMLSVLSSIPCTSPLRSLKLVLAGPNPSRGDGLNIEIISNSWDTFIDSIQRFDKLASLQVVIALPEFPAELRANRVYHPSLVAFFNTHVKENSKGRRYALNVNFVHNTW